MKKQLLNIWTAPVVQVIGPIFIVTAAILAVSAVVAQPYGKSPQTVRGCTNWPLEKDKEKVEKAFDKVLNDSATDSDLRNKLLDSRNCYKTPKEVVQDTLNNMPGDKVTIPPEAVIIFYENDTPGFTRPHPPFADYPSDHCLHIFFLPPTGQPATKASFKENLMCCYKPW